ncbi:MAG TPA: hypothetical protein VJZ50_08445, partial [Candidatus Limnocylindrales bacterium]|nr:hypothetical protein [Candidatus Limnocylindrales bacterium]
MSTSLMLVLSAATAPVVAQGATPGASPLAPTEAPAAAAMDGQVTVYTSVTQDTVDAVLAALAEQRPGLAVEVFRAPTGEL